VPVIAGRASDALFQRGTGRHRQPESVLALLAFVFPLARYLEQIGTGRLPGGQFPDLITPALRASRFFIRSLDATRRRPENVAALMAQVRVFSHWF
jgi:hypothetical protein